MRVLAINFGDETCASSYHRVWQYQKPLRSLGIELSAIAARDFSTAHNLQQYDVVLLQKRLFSRGMVRWIRRHAKRFIYDLDDALWAPQGRKHSLITRFRTARRLLTVARLADLCVVANDVLAQKLAAWGARTTVIPMVLDENRWSPRQQTLSETLSETLAQYRKPDPVALRIGWSGGPANLRYLEAIEAPLAKVQREIPELEVVVHCGECPRFKTGLRYTHVPYKPGEEPEVVRSFDIGLAPLPDDEFAAGKSPIKCIQYMASGVAPVISAVGATRAMFVDGKTGIMARTQADWRQALMSLATDAKLRTAIAANARAEFEAAYALGRQAPVFAQILRPPE